MIDVRPGIHPDHLVTRTAHIGRRRLTLGLRLLARPHWVDRLTPRDHQAITPLIWDHVNPYGRYELDMDSRIPILT